MEKRQKQMEHMGINKDEIEDVSPVQQRSAQTGMTSKGSSANMLAVKMNNSAGMPMGNAGSGQHNMLAASYSVKMTAGGQCNDKGDWL